ncbi:ABC transporter ATP-binding protein [Tannockella kyphosi]|uniref:ABC transporter ATP-binding protein n=1 Tax=Tannockella kyphosi TaxID=2899121 RepID=UPI00201311AA|nr:ABC transporter ATP-binding protein [Tannockella kyphosi]
MYLWKYIKPYKIPASVGFVFKITEAALELMIPIIMAKIIDEGIYQQDMEAVYYYGGMLVLFAVLGYCCAMVCQYNASITSQSVGTAIRKDLYQHIHTLDWSSLDELGSPTLVARLTNDIIQIQLAIAMTIRLTSRAPFLIIGSLVCAYIISGELTMIFIIGGIGLALVMFLISFCSIKYYSQLQIIFDRITLSVRETLAGIRVIRAFSMQTKETTKFKEATDKQYSLQIIVGNLQAYMNPFTFLIVNVCIILIIYQGGTYIKIGTLSQGDIVALVNYMTQILLALVVLTNVIGIYHRAYAGYNRIKEVLATTSKIQDSGTKEWQDNQSVVRFDHVSFAYHKKEVLEDVSFEVKQGETIGIIGGTGSGKTTIANLIGRYYENQIGTIYIDGKEISTLTIASLRKNIGYVMQNARLFTGTIAHNLKIANPQATFQEMEQAIEQAQGKELLNKDGLDKQIEEAGKNLSGGQKQRLTIAQAIIKKPKLFIFDDSASALDAITDRNLRIALQKKQTTTIIISQRISSLQHASRILVLSHGQVVGYDSHEQLLKTCSIYQEIYATQSKGDE